jgi:hypothetical protein
MNPMCFVHCMSLLKPLRIRNMTNFRNAVLFIMTDNEETQRNNFKQSSPYLKCHSSTQILTLSTHLHTRIPNASFLYILHFYLWLFSRIDCKYQHENYTYITLKSENLREVQKV